MQTAKGNKHGVVEKHHHGVDTAQHCKFLWMMKCILYDSTYTSAVGDSKETIAKLTHS